MPPTQFLIELPAPLHGQGTPTAPGRRGRARASYIVAKLIQLPNGMGSHAEMVIAVVDCVKWWERWEG